jgi:hypothetical protein
MRAQTYIASILLLTMLFTGTAFADEYTNTNINTTYHEAPSVFAFDALGEAVGTTISGIPFRQRNVANGYAIRLQRFEIGLAYWYVSDRGVIWADSDLEALSIYLSLA